MTAIEVAGRIDSKRELHLDRPLPVAGPSQVRVIILIPEEDSEQEWSQLAAQNPTFDFLKQPEEDNYTPADGKPFDDQG